MKTKLELTFDLPDDVETFRTYAKAEDFQREVYQFKQFLRGLYKYGHTYETTEDAIEDIYEKFCAEIPSLET